MKSWIVPCIATVATLVVLAGNAFAGNMDQAQASDAEGITGRGLSVGGCAITYKNGLPDLDKLKECVSGKIDKIKADAKEATDDAKAQAQGLQNEINNLKNSPFLAKIESERRMLEAVRQLKLEPFFQCLAVAKIAQGDFSLHIQRFSSDPSKYAADLTNELFELAEIDIQELLAEHLQAAMTPGGLNDPASLVDRSYRTFARLVGRHKVGQCALQHMAPQPQHMKQAILPLLSTLRIRAQRISDQAVSPKLFEAMGKQLGVVLTNIAMLPSSAQTLSGKAGSALPRQEAVPTPSSPVRSRSVEPDPEKEDTELGGQEIATRGIPGSEYLPDVWGIQMIALGVTAEHYARNLNLTSPKLRALTQVLGDPNRAPAALTDLSLALRQSQEFGNDFLFDMGWEILRFAGHKYLDSYCPSSGCGGDLLDLGKDVVLLAKDTVIKVEEGVCSLADIAGGASVVSGRKSSMPTLIWSFKRA